MHRAQLQAKSHWGFKLDLLGSGFKNGGIISRPTLGCRAIFGTDSENPGSKATLSSASWLGGPRQVPGSTKLILQELTGQERVSMIQNCDSEDSPKLYDGNGVTKRKYATNVTH